MLKNKTLWSIFGGFTAAIGAGLCCAGPLILLSIGVSGAWIANLSTLEPYRPVFILLAIALFVWAGWQIFQPVSHCAPAMDCASPAARKKRIILFLVTLLISLGFISSPYWLLLIVE
ncbi:MAG: mercury transporter [Gammaproteobacteria bacterium]|nr:mercury transporter [Gammaproteobacteria bacterium]